MELKVRAWNKVYKHFHEGDLLREYVLGEFIDNDEYEVDFYVNKTDDNGIEIFTSDVVTVQNGYHKYNAIVRIGEYSQDGSGNEYPPTTCYGVYIEDVFGREGKTSLFEFEKVTIIGNIHVNDH